MKKLLPRLLVALFAVLLGIQVIRPEKTNPPITRDVEAPPEVKVLLERACYDCHSNETKWPWYANVAPASWLVVHHVDEGRRELNFSEWDTYDAKRLAHKLEETEEMIESGEMPESSYVIAHAEAKLTDAEKKRLIDWAKVR
ncbi:MAG: heme-binding domain-containing protein [Archangium sp.]